MCGEVERILTDLLHVGFVRNEPLLGLDDAIGNLALDLLFERAMLMQPELREMQLVAQIAEPVGKPGAPAHRLRSRAIGNLTTRA